MLVLPLRLVLFPENDGDRRRRLIDVEFRHGTPSVGFGSAREGAVDARRAAFETWTMDKLRQSAK